MASYTIPEDIIPGALFVPDSHNFFEIVAGGLPNGDDCLRVRGDINPRYKALQEAPVVSPDIFNTRTAVGWAMSFWVNVSLIAIPNAGCQSDKIMFGVMGRSASNPNSSTVIIDSPSDTGTSAKIPNMLWAVTAYAESGGGNPQRRIGFIRQRTYRPSTTSSGGRSDIWNTGVLTSGWHQIIINVPVPSGTAPSGFVDTTAIAGAVTGSFDAAITATQQLYFCIGSYSDHATFNGRNDSWQIGKLAFHDTLLTLTDATLMYNAMTAP